MSRSVEAVPEGIQQVSAHDSQPSIEDYALIGDCHGAALVSRSGSIDWCTALRFDNEPVFFRMLDARGGGSWSIEPDGTMRMTRGYIPRTNILRTRFETA